MQLTSCVRCSSIAILVFSSDSERDPTPSGELAKALLGFRGVHSSLPGFAGLDKKSPRPVASYSLGKCGSAASEVLPKRVQPWAQEATRFAYGESKPARCAAERCFNAALWLSYTPLKMTK